MRGGDQTARHNEVVRAIRQYCDWSKAWSLKVAGGMYQRKGIPDILVCWPPSGRLVAIEVKTGRGVTTIEQDSEMSDLRAAGAVVALVSTVDEVEMVLIKHGLVQVPLLVSRQQAAEWRAASRLALD